MTNKTDWRTPLAAPYLGYLQTMALRQQPSIPVKVHLVDRQSSRAGVEYHHGACGELIKVANMIRYDAPRSPEVQKRIHGCRKCTSRFPAHFEGIPRSIP